MSTAPLMIAIIAILLVVVVLGLELGIVNNFKEIQADVGLAKFSPKDGQVAKCVKNPSVEFECSPLVASPHHPKYCGQEFSFLINPSAR